MKNRRLGGWWRIWIVLSLLWMFGVSLYAVSELPIDRAVQAAYTVEPPRGAPASDMVHKPLDIKNVPLFTSRKELERRIRLYAARDLDGMAKDVRGVVPRASAAGNEADAQRLKEFADWTSQVANPGQSSKAIVVTIEITPFERLKEWLVSLAIVALSVPMTLLIIGLTFQWVVEGFRKPKPEDSL